MTVAGALSVASATASTTHLLEGKFGAPSPVGFNQATALAVDQSTGDLLVIDAKERTLSRFHADGSPSPFSALGSNAIDAKGDGECPTVPADCDQSPEGGFTFGSGFPGEEQVAVDNSGTATDGNIYITQGKQAGGNLVDVFAANGSYLGQLTAAGATKFGTTGSLPFSPCGVAVDGSGDLYLAGGFDQKIYKFDPSGPVPVNGDHVATFPLSENGCNLAAGVGPSAGSLFVSTFFTQKGNSVLKLDSVTGAVRYVVDPGEDTLVTVDPATGHLYAAGGTLNQSGAFSSIRINEYDVSGASSSLVSSTATQIGSQGIAVSGASGKLYASSGFAQGPQGATIDAYGPLVTVPDVTTGSASITGDTSVSLSGEVDPDGVDLEECFFEYGTSTTYGQVAPCTESPAQIGKTPKTVHADISGLAAETLYHYRLAAKNPSATIRGKDETIKTPSKPAIKALWSQEVGPTEAVLKATINPENSPTTYRFEWGTDSSYGQSSGEVALGSDNTDRTVNMPLGGLQPGVTYHYRVFANNNIGSEEISDLTFTTFPQQPQAKADSCSNAVFRTGPSAKLPDCRAFEMVSPIDKGGADIAVRGNGPGHPAGLYQSANDGNSLAYSSEKSFGGAPSAPFTSQYIATRSGAGWSTKPISPSRVTPNRRLGEETNIAVDLEYKAFADDLSSGWFLHDADPTLDACAVPAYTNLYRRIDGSGAYEALTIAKPQNQNPIRYWPALQGLSADGSVAVIAANGKLTDDASSAVDSSTGPIYQLYEHVRGEEGCGELRLISVLPSGNASSSNSLAGTSPFAAEGREPTVANAVSGDGSRVFWTAWPTSGGSGNGAGTLYLHIDGQKTILVSSGFARFWTAAADGSRAIYENESKLFEFDAESKTSTQIAAGSKGMVAASEDASRVYFVSTESIGGEGEPGAPNLYLRELDEGTSETTFIATLGANDFSTSDSRTGDSPTAIVDPAPYKRGVRATADGSRLAFTSFAPLSGYDNHDVETGKPATELFIYDADADELRCVSCNPSGSRPLGKAFKDPKQIDQQDGKVRLAAELPAWENQTFAPRVLSADGNRLFFNSYDALLPRDVNNAKDVYEWEAAKGAKACEQIGAELYVASAGGCLSLISTGLNSSASTFVDATPSGTDVFIKTASSLLPKDPGLIDIYDARIEGGFPPPIKPTECEGESCQSPTLPPNDQTPTSASFKGPGNPTKARCPRRKVRQKGRCVPRKSKSAKQRAKQKRANHKRRAGR